MNYQVIVETGPTDLAANVSLCIYGTDGTTPVLALKSTELRFPSNSRLEFNLSANDVGKVRSVLFLNFVKRDQDILILDRQNQHWSRWKRSRMVLENSRNH